MFLSDSTYMIWLASLQFAQALCMANTIIANSHRVPESSLVAESRLRCLNAVQHYFFHYSMFRFGDNVCVIWCTAAMGFFVFVFFFRFRDSIPSYRHTRSLSENWLRALKRLHVRMCFCSSKLWNFLFSVKKNLWSRRKQEPHVKLVDAMCKPLQSTERKVFVVHTNSASPWQHHTSCQLFYDHCSMEIQLKCELCTLSCHWIGDVTLTRKKKKKKASSWLLMLGV